MAAKVFEVGDVLPATTQLRIGWVGDITNFLGDKYIYSDNGHFELVSRFEDSDNIYIARSSGAGVLIFYGETYIFVHPYTNYNGVHPYCDIDTSTWDINSRTVSSVSPGMDVFTWEDLAPAPSGYTITFNSNGGTSISDIEDATELPTPLPTPTKSGYTFLGWYYDSSFTQEASAGDILTANVTLYAKWEQATSGPKIFEVGDVLPATTQLKISWNNSTDYMFRDDTVARKIRSNSGTYNILDFRIASTTYYNYGFLHGCQYDIMQENQYNHTYSWFSSYETNKYCIVNTTSLTLAERTISHVNTTSLTYTWEDLNPPTYSITFDSNGGSIVPQTSNATQLPDPLPITTKPGYTFVAWYIDSALTTRAVAGATIEEDTTLYAKWHTLGSLFTEIADAIRSKDGTSENIRDVDFGERIKQIQGAKVEQTKTVSPTTSSQDVLPDSGKVLSKVTVNAIPTETKSQQPNLSSGNQTINATSGKFMTSFTITKDTINHIASNIRSGITLYGVAGNLQPAKEEETKTLEPDFSGGNQVITPTSGKVLSQVTLTKPTDLLPENIAKDKNVCGVVGTLEGGGGGYTVTFTRNTFNGYSNTQGGIHYSFDNGVTYHPISDVKSVITDSWEIVPVKLMGVTQIRFKIVAKNVYKLVASVGSVLTPSRQSGNWSAESSNITLSSDVTYELEWWED